MVHIEDLDEARACAAAGIDLLSIETPIWDAAMRDAAGECFVQVGLQYGQLQTTEDYLRAAHDAMMVGGDCCCCAASTHVDSGSYPRREHNVAVDDEVRTQFLAFLDAEGR